MNYVAQIDLDAEDRATLRTRFGQADLDLKRVHGGLFHIYRPGVGHVATFYLLGTLGNGDKVYHLLARPRVATWLTNKLGARIRTWLDAASDTQVRGVLGGKSIQAWLLDEGGCRAYQDPPDALEPRIERNGWPIPRHVISGKRPEDALR